MAFNPFLANHLAMQSLMGQNPYSHLPPMGTPMGKPTPRCSLIIKVCFFLAGIMPLHLQQTHLAVSKASNNQLLI